MIVVQADSYQTWHARGHSRILLLPCLIGKAVAHTATLDLMVGGSLVLHFIKPLYYPDTWNTPARHRAVHGTYIIASAQTPSPSP